MNAIDLLKQQHAKVLLALTKMTDGQSIDPKKVRMVADELVAHMVIEEHIFYPRVRQLMKDTISEAFEEHAVARFELARALMARGDEQKTRLNVLKEILHHHIDEEQEEIFPRVKREVSSEELVRLGMRMKTMFDKAVAKGFESLVRENGRELRVATGSQRPAARGGRTAHTAHAR